MLVVNLHLVTIGMRAAHVVGLDEVIGLGGVLWRVKVDHSWVRCLLLHLIPRPKISLNISSIRLLLLIA